MQRYFITFRSVTYAQKGERALVSRGLYCHMGRTPRWMESRGCGYALEVREPEKAVEILKRAGASYQKVYRIPKNGKPEVLEL